MKHIKLFEQWIYRSLSKSDVKKLQKLGYNAELDVYDDSHDVIKVTDGPNPWKGSRHVYDYYWNGKDVWSTFGDEGLRQGSDYKKDVTSVDGFIDAMNDGRYRFWSD